MSNAEQIGAIPERGVPIGTVILRSIPVFGSITPTPIPTPGGGYYAGPRVWQKEEFYPTIEQLKRSDEEVLEVLATILPIILN